MNITPRSHHHGEVVEPDVWATCLAGRLHDVTLELPDCLVELTADEAMRLRDALTAALAPRKEQA